MLLLLLLLLMQKAIANFKRLHTLGLALRRAALRDLAPKPIAESTARWGVSLRCRHTDGHGRPGSCLCPQLPVSLLGVHGPLATSWLGVTPFSVGGCDGAG